MPISTISQAGLDAPISLTSPTLTTPKATTTLGVGNATPSASGAGVTFPATQSASTDANTLDDYEEGTWTPAVSADSGSATYNDRFGTYTKIGRQVTINFWIYGSGRSTLSGTSTITGLPFTGSDIQVRPSAMFRTNGITITGILGGWMGQNATAIQLDANSNGGATGLSASSISTGSFEIGGFISYIVD
jgi:hypothetical protein